ncbi:MAG: PA14 domain-containing protein [Planctomycetaceae bacterium]
MSTSLAGIAVLLAVAVSAPVIAQDDLDFVPGLLTTITSDGRSVQRIDSTLSFDWDNGVPDARIGKAPFSAEWSGRLLVRQPGSHTFHAHVTGQVTIIVGGDTVLEGHGTRNFVSGKPVALAPGDHLIAVRFHTEGVSQPRLQVFWSSENFTLEPLPADILFREQANADVQQQESGKLLVDAFRCAACHRDSAPMQPQKAPSLERVAGSHVGESLVSRLMNPNDVVSNSHMPDFGLSRDEAEAVAAFLLNISQKAHSDAPGKFDNNDRDAGRKLLTSVGCVACHKVPGISIPEVPLSDPYDAPDLTDVARRRPVEWLDRWLRDPASLNPEHRMPVFDLDPKQRRQIVAALQNAQSSAPLDVVKQVSDAEQIALGKRIVEQTNCAACHAIPGITPPREPVGALTQASLTSEGHRCIDQRSDSESTTRLPQFRFSDTQIKQLAAWLKSVDRPLVAAGSFERGELLLHRNGCVACHDRNLSRGLSSIAARLQGADAELSGQSQALIPPSLTAVGDKLRDDFLNRAVAGEQPNRRMPWLLVRMPRFRHSPSERDDLVQYLIAADRIPDAADDVRQDLLANLNPAGVKATSDDLLLGNRLTGAGGFNCVACHQAGSFEPRNVAPGTRGSDLMTMGQRIRPKYFQRWMANPLRVIAGVEMPAIRKAMPDVHGGSLPKQLATIWHALADERFTPPTVTSRFEQVVNVEPGGQPRIIRDVFTIGEGRDRQAVARAMAIGFSNGHNILIDLDTMQIRQWTVGEFARQRTEGKSWYWDMAGITVAAPNGPEVPYRLTNADASRSLLPVPDESQTAELVEYRTVSDAIEVVTRFRFDLSDSHGQTDRDDEPHFTTRRWQDANRPLETVTVRYRFDEASMQGNSTGWRQLVELVDGPPGWKLSVPMFYADRGTGSGSDVWDGRIVQIPAAADVDLNRGESVTFLTGTSTRLSAVGTAEMLPSPVSDIEAVTSTPGFDGQRLPLPMSIMPTAIAWLPDGRMVFTSLKGHVWIASDSDADGLPDDVSLFEEGLAAPFGIVPDGDSILVSHKPEILRLTDTDGDGRADLREVFASGWGYNDNYHDWTTGLIRDEEGNYFAGLGSDYSQKERPKNQDRWRGGVIRIDPSGNVTPVAMSFRYPMGLAFDRNGNLWATDNQGVQNTFNEINQILPGRHYGVPSAHQPTNGLQHETPGLMIPHPWVRSVNSILFLPDDYKVESLRGHGIGCEYDNRMLIRFTIQDVGGVLQGASYNFSRPDSSGGGSNFIGPICSAISPAGELYIGSIWDSGWQGGQNNGGMTRLLPSKNGLPNGIRELRATATGFEVEFFEPIDEAAARNPESWSIQGYTRVWGGDYATPDSGRRALTPSQIRIDEDRRLVRFDVDELKPGYMYDVAVTGPLADSEQMWPVEGHYSMKVVPNPE